ncbi:MAG TPA: SpvB/TcaC N-terminal domain-containing protein, partial [Thermomicrobiales bacterium]
MQSDDARDRPGQTGNGAAANGPTVPPVTVPKGGGAIRGIGEKFGANPVTGTASMTVPIATSPGRSGFTPQLALSYDSGAGNGPFGFGWSLSLPAISRKTDKGLPTYDDAAESDTFILSGTEDLVRAYTRNAAGDSVPDETDSPDGAHHIVRYRPRVEGLFARIERWREKASGAVHWRSISKENVTTIYGKDEASQIHDSDASADPADRRIFSWLICETYDDKGNATVYDYVGENDAGVDRSQANERNRARSANRYLKRVRYGNAVSRLSQPDLTAAQWHFEVVFDYDEGHYETVPPDPAQPQAAQHRLVRAAAPGPSPWRVRPDPFSSYRSGFEVRTYRRCHRVLTFHRFAELSEHPYLVRSTEFDFDDLDQTPPPAIETELAHPGSTRIASFIRAVTQSGYARDDDTPPLDRDGTTYLTYRQKSLPALEFTYSQPTIQDDVRELDAESLENLPIGLDGTAYQWADLDGEGAPGILTEQAGAWFYKPNEGDGRFGPLQTVSAKPSHAALANGRQQLLDLAGDGRLDLVDFAGPTPGFSERTDDAGWSPFTPFASLPTIAWDDPNLRFVDL